MRVLIFSHTYMSARYRGKWRWLAANGADLTLVAIPKLRLATGTRLNFENCPEPFAIRLVPPLAFNDHNILRFYSPRQLAALIEETRPSIVHVEAEPHSILLAMLARLKARFGFRLVAFMWENIRRRGKKPLAWLEPYSLARVDALIAGNAEAGEVARWRGYRGPLAIIPQVGFDPTHWDASADLPAEYRGLQNCVRIGFAGRLVPEKGVLDLLEAFCPLAERAALIFLGVGASENLLRERARQAGIAERVLFPGFIPHDRILPYLKNLDILVLPSRTAPAWKEQFGHVLVEAMLAHVPVVGSDCGAIPQVIGNGGVIFPEGDVTQLRARLIGLIEQPAERERLAQKGYVRALLHYTDAAVARATLEVYQKVMVCE